MESIITKVNPFTSQFQSSNNSIGKKSYPGSAVAEDDRKLEESKPPVIVEKPPLPPLVKPPAALASPDLDEHFPIVLDKPGSHRTNKVKMLPSGAYATHETSLSVKREGPKKNNVFSLAALQSLDNNHGFRSGVFGLK